MRPILLAVSLLAASGVSATEPSREHFVPRGMERAYTEYHYSPVVKVGDMVIVSGIPAGPGETYEERIRAMFKRLKAQLESAGASMADVVEINTFHAHIKDSASFHAEFAKFAPIHHEYFPANYPAWTAVGTTALLSDGAPVEMRVMAIIGSGKSPKVDIAQPAQ